MPRRDKSTVDRALLPFQYEVLWHLAEVCDSHAGDASARDLFESYYTHKPDHQRWSGRKVANVLRSLRERGLVDHSGDVDTMLPGCPTRRYWLTEKGRAWLAC